MTEETFPVKEEAKVILPKPTDDIIPLSSYVQDAKNRWKIHQYEVKALSKDCLLYTSPSPRDRG